MEFKTKEKSGRGKKGKIGQNDFTYWGGGKVAQDKLRYVYLASPSNPRKGA